MPYFIDFMRGQDAAHHAAGHHAGQLVAPDLRDMIAMQVAPDVKQIWITARKTADGEVTPADFAAESAKVAAACYIFADAMIAASTPHANS